MNLINILDVISPVNSFDIASLFVAIGIFAIPVVVIILIIALIKNNNPKDEKDNK